MDIAALSMGMSQMQVAQQASVSVMKMAMDTGSEQMTEMVKMVDSGAGPSPDPNIGQFLDVTV
ncbi:YjfB family protein [Acetobacterium woodii]|nr:YjfB family protein [Acetobacterium woodii]